MSTDLSAPRALLRLLLLAGGVAAVALVGDRLMGWAGHRALLESELRFSRLYRGDLPADVLVLGNSRGVNALLAPALEERAGRPARTLAWNGLSAGISALLWDDWLERHEAPELLLVEVSFLSVPDHRVGEFRPFFRWSPGLSGAARRDAPQAWWGCRVAELYCLNSPLTLRAAYYAVRSDQGWVNRYRISPALLAATDTMAPEPLNPILPHNVEALRRVVAEARSEGTRVRLVWAPWLPAYRARLQDPEGWIGEAERLLGETVVDLSAALDDPTLFSDRIHLNDRGARVLADTLAARGLLEIP